VQIVGFIICVSRINVFQLFCCTPCNDGCAGPYGSCNFHWTCLVWRHKHMLPAVTRCLRGNSHCLVFGGGGGGLCCVSCIWRHSLWRRHDEEKTLLCNYIELFSLYELDPPFDKEGSLGQKKIKLQIFTTLHFGHLFPENIVIFRQLQ